MNKNNFLSAIEACDNQKIVFTNQALEAFSFGGIWYPLHATINYAIEITKEKTRNFDNTDCRRKLDALGILYTKKTISFKRQTPKPLSYEEKLEDALLVK